MSESASAATAVAASRGGPPVAASLPGAGAFEVRGSDAASFLHGQLAADIAVLRPGHVTRSLLLNHRGHAMAEAMVLRGADDLLVIVDDSLADWVGATLAGHIVFDDVTLTRSAAAATVTLQGTRAADTLETVLPAAADVVVSLRTGQVDAFWLGSHPTTGHTLTVYPRQRSAAGGVDLTVLGASGPVPVAAGGAGGVTPGVNAGAAAALLLEELLAAGAVRVPPGAIDSARVVAGVAMAGRDGGAGVLPQEAGLTAGLSYRKGCYLGQEVMARIEARGSLKRGLVTVEVAAPVAEVSAAPADTRAIESGGRTVGTLGTVAVMPDGRLLALAVLRLDLDRGAVLTAGGREVRLAHSPPL